VTKPPDLVPVQPFPSPPSNGSFVSGAAAAADRTRVEYFRDPATNRLHATVRFGPHTEGPPSSVHGGAIAAVLDEAMGAVCWMNDHPVVGARITINYRHLTPLGFTGHVEAWIEGIDGRKIAIRSQLRDPAGKVHAEGEALFIKLAPDMRAQLDAARRARRV
jgi:acyl-coenzyme A thioesterase PaaI-like protein